MSLSDYKLTDGDVAEKGVVAAPDRLTGTAAQNKAVFDRLIREAVKGKLNGLIDALTTELARTDAFIAPTEDGATVSKAYWPGNLFFHLDTLYRVTKDIPQGGYIIINAGPGETVNCVETDVSKAIYRKADYADVNESFAEVYDMLASQINENSYAERDYSAGDLILWDHPISPDDNEMILVRALTNISRLTYLELSGSRQNVEPATITDVIKEMETSIAGKAPTSHAATNTAYGKGTESKYGHVKLSDAVDSTLDNTNGTAATPKAVKTAYDLAFGKAPLASPAFTGNPTAPTQSAGNSSTRIATTAFIQTALQNTEAALFSASSNYFVGEYVMYNGKLYRCTTDHSASAWDANDFTEITVGTVLFQQDRKISMDEDAKELLDDQVMKLVNALAGSRELDFSTASRAYARGSYFLLGSQSSEGSATRLIYSLYRATADIAQGAAIVTSGSGQNCEKVTVGEELNGKLSVVGKGKNLIVNGYFVGGGSQLGNGIFPINQRAVTSLTNSGYFIDRWKKTTGTGATVNLDSDGLYSSSSSAAFLRQAYQNKSDLIGKTLTYSILYKNAGLTSVTNVLEADGRFTVVGATGEAAYSTTGIMLTNEVCGFYAPTGTERVLAVKLELGDTQTLARQVNGAWVLNDVPDFDTELMKCQRYFQVFRTQALRPTYGMDFRPPMATNEPTLDSFTKDNVTYYTASSEM